MLNKRKLKSLISWLLVLIWMILIFTLSSQTADQSNELSQGITEKVIETVQMITQTSDSSMESFNHIVRKCAHFTAYLILALLVQNALRQSGQRGLRKFGLTMLICVLYASSDEFHQMFVAGRGPQVSDVFIDSAGAAVGVGIYYLRKKLIGKYRNKRVGA